MWACGHAVQLRYRDMRGNGQDTGDEGDTGKMWETQGMRAPCVLKGWPVGIHVLIGVRCEVYGGDPQTG